MIGESVAAGLDTAARASSGDVPTFAAYVPVVSGAVTPGTRRVYESYWNRVVAHWGERRIDEPRPSEIQALCEYLRAQRVMRRNGRGVGAHCFASHRVRR